MAAVRCQENIIKATHQRYFPVGYFMFVDTEQLLRQLSLVNTVIMVESGLRSPADMQGGSHMSLRPV